jgi:ATP-binding cassette subfamily B protein
LLGFYSPNKGQIIIENNDLENINHAKWREKCGVVMQDGYLFTDTIAKNIAISDPNPDMQRVVAAARIANIAEYIESLPLNYFTVIGQDGQSVSQGQRQRILIARIVYKNPQYIFLDEATNALDANNEKAIVENLSNFYKGKTVVIVAHRLSTVKNADQIIVLNNGKVTEIGSHQELTDNKGEYFNLVKNQLELGN